MLQRVIVWPSFEQSEVRRMQLASGLFVITKQMLIFGLAVTQLEEPLGDTMCDIVA